MNASSVCHKVYVQNTVKKKFKNLFTFFFFLNANLFSIPVSLFKPLF